MFSKIKDRMNQFSKNIEAKQPLVSNRYFSIRCRAASVITGIVCFLITLLCVLFNFRAFSAADVSGKWWLLTFALLCPFLISGVIVFKIQIIHEKWKKAAPIMLLILLPVAAISMTECLNNIFIYDMTYLGFLANYTLIFCLYLLFFAATGSFRASYLISNSILYVLALAHSYIVDFRGTPFLPMDFLSAGTAIGVANTYNYAPTYKTVIGTLLFLFLTVVAIKAKTPKYQFRTKVIFRSATGAFCILLFVLYWFTDLFVNAGAKPDFWNQSRGYRNYGFAFNFFANTKYMYMSEPDNYNPADVEGYVDNTVKNDSRPKKPDSVSVQPNIICVMNESLADMNVLGNLETNEDYMPFIRSLTENTVRGNLFVPVIGAGTSNTEFEFLTGHSISFLPSGSNAYMLYIKKPLASLVSTLKAQGYSSYALHPYYAAGWNRTDVYNLLGFEKFTSLENIIDIHLMEKFQENGSDPNYLQQLFDKYYPGKNMLIRQYISDSYNYKLLIKDFENRDKSVPYFAFNVTMQNHGGYTNSCVNFDQNIYPTSVQGDYIKAKNYLSLVQKSDVAFRELIEYFSQVTEPTIICMFGDHQPSVETKFIQEVMGVNSLSRLPIEEEQKRYITPFIIWANYDIEEKQIDKISSNYLSSLLLEVAGAKLTEYNKYLLTLSETLPVIDSAGYIDAQGNYYKWSDSSPYSEKLAEYERIQYNNIFDQENVASDIFYLEGFVPQANTESSETP